MENKIKKIIIANAVLSNENFNKVKEISLPNGDIKTIGLFSKQYIATLVDAVTGAGKVNAGTRKNKLASAIERLFNNPESEKIKEMSKRAKDRLEKFEASLSAGVIAVGSAPNKETKKERERI